MNKFTNVNIKKEYKKKIRGIIISVVLILIGIVCKYLSDIKVKNINKNRKDLDSIITSDVKDKANKLAYLDVKAKPFLLAVSKSTKNKYYIMSDGEFLYIAYMSPEDYKKLNVDSITEKSIRVEGMTKYTSKEIQKFAIDAYNEGLEEDKKITSSDFNSYFGSVYLDMTKKASDEITLPLILFIATLGVGNIMLIVTLISLFVFAKSINKLDGMKINELDNEMNDSTAFYYSKVRLYLTKNYIINFNGSFRAIKYTDILWMYPYEVRRNGVKVSQSIKILVNDAKTYIIATIDVYTKKSKAVYDEIWDTIVSKNKDMLLGYTSENIKTMNKKIKEIKKEKKNK